MKNPVTDAFFFGRALADVISEKLGDAFTDVMSEIGKFDAEQREKLRKFTEEVAERAHQDSQKSAATGGSSTAASVGLNSPEELQKMIDDLRAEIAGVRSELNKYRRQ